MTLFDADADADDRCERESDGRHRWHYDEPPEHLLDEVHDWDQAQWDDWYDMAGRTCYSCGERDVP
jgi:hypothetical protein